MLRRSASRALAELAVPCAREERRPFVGSEYERGPRRLTRVAHGDLSAVQHRDLDAGVLPAERALAPARAVELLRRHNDAIVRHPDHLSGSTVRQMRATVAVCICTCIWSRHLQLADA